MVILKIPIIYLCFVVYYAIKAAPKPEAGASVTAQLGDPEDGPERAWTWVVDLGLTAANVRLPERSKHWKVST